MQQLSAKVTRIELSDDKEIVTLRFSEATSGMYSELKVPNTGRYRLGDSVVYFRGDVAVDEDLGMITEKSLEESVA